MLTPVDAYDGWWAKREDLAAYAGPEHPSGAKVRQYAAMIRQAPDDAVLVVGCSADSGMQVYLAYAAWQLGREGHVFVPARARQTTATQLAAAYGAHVTEVRPGYLSVCRARAREFALGLGKPVVRWDLDYAATDTAAQVHNLPDNARRIIVPTGSGLTAAGILSALTAAGTGPDVLAVCVSGMADKESILATANKRVGYADPARLQVVEATVPYGKRVPGQLPDGTELDPYYAGKALPYVEQGDVLWVSGRRPV